MSSRCSSWKIGALVSLPVKPKRNSWATARSSGSRRARSASERGADGPLTRSGGGGISRRRNDTWLAGSLPLAVASGRRSVFGASLARPRIRTTTAPTTTATRTIAATWRTTIRLRPGPGTSGKLSLGAMAQPAQVSAVAAQPGRDQAQLVVMKFGGTSVADAERIKRAARRIVATKEAGNSVVAVLSARGKTTDALIDQAKEVSDHPDPREMDMLLSTGERQSCALA